MIFTEHSSMYVPGKPKKEKRTMINWMKNSQ